MKQDKNHNNAQIFSGKNIIKQRNHELFILILMIYKENQANIEKLQLQFCLDLFVWLT